MTDLDIFFMKSEIAYLKNRIEQFENGSVYTGLINEISALRVEVDALKTDSVKLDDVRRLLG